MSSKVKKKVLAAAGITALILVAAILALGVFELVVNGMKNSVDFAKAGKRWSADGSPYAVIAAYAEDGCGVDSDMILQWEHSMDQALTEASISSDGGRAWTWAASFDTQLSPVGNKGSTLAEVTVCMGDFFVFHNFNYLYGSGFLNDPTNPMGVVLDEDLAWKLFGAQNIVGMTFMINDEEYTVTGVVRATSKNGAYGYTYGTRPRMYMSYAGFSKLSTGQFTCYETAIPNPVKSFAKNIFDTVVSLNQDRSDVVEVTDRFSIENRFGNMKKLKYSWISINKLEYPYWENEAKVYDYRCATLMIWEIIIVSIAVASLLTSIVLVVVSGYSIAVSAKNIFGKVSAKIRKKK